MFGVRHSRHVKTAAWGIERLQAGAALEERQLSKATTLAKRAAHPLSPLLAARLHKAAAQQIIRQVVDRGQGAGVTAGSSGSAGSGRSDAAARAGSRWRLRGCSRALASCGSIQGEAPQGAGELVHNDKGQKAGLWCVGRAARGRHELKQAAAECPGWGVDPVCRPLGEHFTRPVCDPYTAQAWTGDAGLELQPALGGLPPMRPP